MGNITILIFAAIGAFAGAFMFFYFAMRSKYLHGPTGAQGAPGLNGKDGVPGIDGKDGLNGKHGKDGAPGLNFGRPLFKGNDGRDGAPGPDGKSGKDGVSITSAIVNAEGQLVIMFSDGSSYVSDSLVGPQGHPGRNGRDAQGKVQKGLRRKHLGQIDPGQGVT